MQHGGHLGRPSTALGLLLAVLLSTAPVRADEEGEERDRGAAPRGASGAIIVPPKKQRPAGKQKITFPSLKRHAEPVYPPEAVKRGIEGEVVLKLTIETSGAVSKAEVVRPVGHGLDEAAVAAAEQLLFEPAKKPDGSAVRAQILFKYTFTLEPAKGAEQASKVVLKAKLTATVAFGADKSPLAGAEIAVVRADGSTVKLYSDGMGRFRLHDLDAGALQITVKAAGFETLAIKEELAAGEALEVRYLMVPLSGEAAGDGVTEVFVEGERNKREVLRRTVERREIDRIPGTKGDALRALENMPGVARPPAFSGLLIVRGSAPADTQTFFDGAPVPLAYHFGGLASVVPTEMLERIDFYPGNFSSRYGSAMGGVVDVKLRSPRTDDYHGFAQVDFIDGRLQFEGPIPWLDDWGFVMAGRRSWIDALLTPAIEAAGADVVQTPAYYDYQFMVENKPDDDTRFRISFYGSDDGFELAGGDEDDLSEEATFSLGLHIAFQRLQLGYQSRLNGGHALSWMLSLNRDVLDLELRAPVIGSILFNTEVLAVTNRLEYSHRFAEWLGINVGMDFNSGLATVTSRLPADLEEEEEEGRPKNDPFVPPEMEERAFERTFSRPAVFTEAEITPLKRVRLVPGVRLDYTLQSDHFDVSPRFNTSYGMFEGFPQTTIKAAVGLYHQPPGFLQITGSDGNPDLESQRAIHYGLGLEQDITRQIEVSVEGFVKGLDKLVVTSEEEDENYDNDGTGYVAGGELLVKYKPDDHFFGWLAYTLSKSVRRDRPGEEQYLADFDQTHIFTILGSYRLGRGWELGARFRLVSGNLVKAAICDRADPACDTKMVNAIYHAPSASYVTLLGGSDEAERLPLFHQLDVRMDKTWTMDAWKIAMYIDILNIYNHQAAEGINYNFNLTDREYINGLPLIPSFGLRGEF